MLDWQHNAANAAYTKLTKYYCKINSQHFAVATVLDPLYKLNVYETTQDPVELKASFRPQQRHKRDSWMKSKMIQHVAGISEIQKINGPFGILEVKQRTISYFGYNGQGLFMFTTNFEGCGGYLFKRKMNNTVLQAIAEGFHYSKPNAGKLRLKFGHF